MKALVLIDIQAGFQSPAWGRRNNPVFEGAVSALLAHWRNHELGPVVHVQHLSLNAASPLHPDRNQIHFMDCARPHPNRDELVIRKHQHSAFVGTLLEQEFNKRGIENLVIGGLTTDHCVSTSVRTAHDLGFKVLVPQDAVATFPRGSFDADTVQNVALASLTSEFADLTTVSQLIRGIHDY